MHTFESNGLKVYTDMAVILNRNIAALSIIGSDIAVKAIRAEFMDGNRRAAYYRLYSDENTFRVVKPPAGFKQLPQIKTEQGLQVFLMRENLLWGMSRDDLRVRAYQHLQDLNIPGPTPADKEFDKCMDAIIHAGEDTGYFQKCDVISPHLKLQTAKFFLIEDICLDDFLQQAEGIIASYLIEDSTPEELLEGIEGIADYIERYAKPIGDKVSQRVKYLHMPGDYQNEFFDNLGRRLFPQQKDISVAAAKSMQAKGYAIISGQMGVGSASRSVI